MCYAGKGICLVPREMLVLQLSFVIDFPCVLEQASWAL